MRNAQGNNEGVWWINYKYSSGGKRFVSGTEEACILRQRVDALIDYLHSCGLEKWGAILSFPKGKYVWSALPDVQQSPPVSGDSICGYKTGFNQGSSVLNIWVRVPRSVRTLIFSKSRDNEFRVSQLTCLLPQHILSWYYSGGLQIVESTLGRL